MWSQILPMSVIVINLLTRWPPVEVGAVCASPGQAGSASILPPWPLAGAKLDLSGGSVCICSLIGEAEHLFRCWGVLCVLFLYCLIAFTRISIGCWFFLFCIFFLCQRAGLL